MKEKLDLEKYIEKDTLNLSNLKLSEEAENILLFLENNPHIINLSLTNTDITDSFGVILAQKLRLPNLDISRTKISSITATELSKNQYIKFLNIGFNKITEDGIIAIASTPNKIEKLDITYCGAGVESAIALSKNERITHLNIGNQISFCIDFGNTEQFELNLFFCENRNQIRDEGAIYIAQSKSIISLDVSTNSIGMPGITALGKNNILMALNLSNLRKEADSALSMFQHYYLDNQRIYNFGEQTYNQLDEEGIILLARHPCLQELDIRNIPNALTERCFAALAENTHFKKLYIDLSSYPTRNAMCMMSESAPLNRANNARNFGLKTEIPTLTRLSIFAVSKTDYSSYKSFLPKHLKDALVCATKCVDIGEPDREINIYGI